MLGKWTPGPRFNIKMPSYQYRKSHCGDKTILRPSYLHNGISYTGKMTSLYWIRALVTLYGILGLSHRRSIGFIIREKCWYHQRGCGTLRSEGRFYGKWSKYQSRKSVCKFKTATGLTGSNKLNLWCRQNCVKAKTKIFCKQSTDKEFPWSILVQLHCRRLGTHWVRLWGSPPDTYLSHTLL